MKLIRIAHKLFLDRGLGDKPDEIWYFRHGRSRSRNRDLLPICGSINREQGEEFLHNHNHMVEATAKHYKDNPKS